MHKFAITAISLAVGLAFAQGAAAADNDVFNRAAKGDLATFGGAARIKGDMAKLYEEQLKLASKQHAKNVILFIGDGVFYGGWISWLRTPDQLITTSGSPL